jgi:flagellar hook-associated protein 2
MSITLNTSTATSGGGIDVTAVVNQILAAERAPEKLWQQQQATLSLQTTTLNTIGANLSSLKDKVNSLKDVVGALTAKAITSSNTSILTASGDASAIDGNHTVVVSNLATTSSYYTDPLASSTTVFDSGTINLKIGAGASLPITVDATNNTLDFLVSYINGRNLGVTASVVNDATGARLAIVSQSTGEPGDLTIDTDIAQLAFHKSLTGKNATLTIDGVPISSASNTVTGALAGVTLNLASAAPSTAVQVSVGPDTARAKQAVNDFVSAYNLAMASINLQFTVDPKTNTAGPLGSDGMLRWMQSSLLSDVTYAIEGNNGITGLASIGVKMQDDGTLTVDDEKLTDVITNQFTDFQNLFQQINTEHPGFANHFGTDLMSITDSTTGIVATDLKQITSTQDMLTKSINDMEDRLAVREQQLITQYSQIDAALRQYPLIMAQLTAQLATLPQYQVTL